MPTSDFFNRYLNALAEIHGSFSIETTQENIVRYATLLFEARGASIFLYHPSEERLIASANFGLSDSYKSKGTVAPDKSLGEITRHTPVVVNDTATDSNVQYREAAIQEGIKSIVGLPLPAGGALIGSLRLYFAQKGNFGAEDISFFVSFAHQAGMALKTAFYFSSMQAALAEIQQMPSLEYKVALKSLLETVVQFCHARAGAVLLLDNQNNTLNTVMRCGLSEKYLKKGPLFAGVSLGEVNSGKPVVISNVAIDSRVQYKEAAAEEKIVSILGLPLKVGGKIAGALRLYYSFAFEPDRDYLVWAGCMADQMGFALEKSQMLIQLKEKANWYEGILKDFER